MKWIKKQIKYLDRTPDEISNLEWENQRAIDRVQQFRPIGNQCIYAINYIDENLLYLTGNVHGLFGYSPEEIHNLEFFYSLIHPEDKERVQQLTLQGVRVGKSTYQIEPMDHVFHISYRMRRKDSTYIKVQRQTGILTRGSNGNMITSFGIFTDITHLDKSNVVQGLMTGEQIPGYQFLTGQSTESVHFSKREKEIIDLLAEGFSSKEIAEKLFISVKTVYTHRQNILKRVGVKNTVELMSYVFKNGY